jgi:hypothetical protein
LEISTFAWPDDGAKASEYFSWIGPVATSPDKAASTRAGQSARAIAGVLSENPTDASSIAPRLITAYGLALTPFQGALVGYDSGVRGFGQLGNPGDYDAARNVFGAIATNRDTGTAFVDNAYDRALAIASSAAEKVCADRSLAEPIGTPAVKAAASLFGLAGSVTEPPRDRPQSIDQLSYAMASACLRAAKAPPEGRITDYIENGQLMSPDQVAQRDSTLENYYQSLRDYIGYMGIDTSNYSRWYDEARGE